MQTKTCTKCGVEKSVDEFTKRKPTKSGDTRTTMCKMCKGILCKLNKMRRQLIMDEEYEKYLLAGVTKQCVQCNQTLEISKFYRKSSGKYFVDSRCKECRIGEYNKLYQDEYRKLPKRKLQKEQHYIKHCEYVKTKSKQWRADNPEKVLEQGRRRRAKKRGLNEQYSVDDKKYTLALFNNCCVNCGSPHDLCIDHHIALSKGHVLTKENAVVLCRSCNSKKRAKNPEDFYSNDKLLYIEEKLKEVTEEYRSLLWRLLQ